MNPRWTSWMLAAAIATAPLTGRAADAPESAEAAAERALIGQDLEHPPRGTPDDQALWKSGIEVTQRIQIERARATRLQMVLSSLRYTERLDVLAARPGDEGKQGTALRQRVSDAHRAQFAVLTARWPVDTYRVCGYPAMELGSMMMYDQADPADLQKHRAMLLACVEQAQASVKLMKDGNDALEAALNSAEGALVVAGIAVPTAAPTAAAATKAPAPARDGHDAHEHEAHEHARRHAEER